MDVSTCMVIDVWEGNPVIDVNLLVAKGVAGMGIRLNDMNGGHHLDKNFWQTWSQALGLVRYPYFVYNPWINADANFQWLMQNIPTECTSVAIDVEVKYTGYSPTTYAAEVASFNQKCKDRGLRTIIYTGQWFLPNLSHWPVDQDYWWAQYPDPATYFSGVTTWEQLMAKLDDPRLTKPFNSLSIPGNLKMWQINDSLLMPGLPDHFVDTNVFFGTPSDLAEYFGTNPNTPVPPVVAPKEVKPGICYIKDDLAAGWEAIGGTRPFLRNGLPSSVNIWGGKGTVKLTPEVIAYVYSINYPLATNYMFISPTELKSRVGWRNMGDPNVVEQVTFSGNIVNVTRIVEDRAYIECVMNTQAMPSKAVKPTEISLHKFIHLLSTQYRDWLDVTTNGRYPRIIGPLANPGEELYMDVRDLVSCSTVTVKLSCLPWLNMRTGPGTGYPVVGVKLPGSSVLIIRTTTINGIAWGLTYGGWVALRYTSWLA